MSKLSPLDDQNTYYRYAAEAKTRLDKLDEERASRQKAAKGLVGKAAAMGDTLGFFADKNHNLKAGDAAYDATENIRESMQEDALKSYQQANDKIRAAQEAREKARRK